MKCSRCHFENAADTHFCANCGAPLSPGRKTPTPAPAPGPTLTASISLGELVSGTTFGGRYRICDELGRGGMGRVYKAIDREINEAVALKILNPEIGFDEKMIDRFRNELRLARRISHKNVCRIHDLGVAEGIYFISMEYIPGDNLKSIIRMMGPLSTARTLSIAGQVCDGMAEAHGLGIIHRDLKTANIMIDREGNAHVMDFGIARAAVAEGLTDRGTMIGTPEYMAPEQIEGENVDQRADIYSLGVILFEMLTGRVPFEGLTPLSVAMKQKTARPPNPRELNPRTPEALDTAIIKCLEKDPASRYQKIEALASDLHGVAKVSTGVEKAVSAARTDTTTSGGTRLVNSIAVLPFTDLSPQKDQEYFCEGLAEEIINALTKITNLEVAAKTSAFSARFKAMDVREVGQQLGVGAVLEGSVRKDEKRLRITAQLINVATGYHFWSEMFERPLEDIFTVQDEITLAIVDRLKVRVLGDEKAVFLKRHTENPEAYNLYLQGRHSWNERTPDGLKKGLECFLKAIEKDPSYARAHTGVSDCYGLMGYYFLPSRYAFTKARDAAAKALEIDDTLADAHSSMAFAKENLERDWVATEKGFRRAIELDPDYIWAHHWYALYMAARGRHSEALTEMKRALDVDPSSPHLIMVLGMIYYLARFYDRAVNELRKVVEMDPHHVFASFYLGLAYLEKGRFEEAMAHVRRSAHLTGNAPFFVQGVGYVHASWGQPEEARAVLAALEEMMKKTYVSPVFTALIHFKLGEDDRGFEWLDKAFEEGDHWLEYIKVFPGFDSVRTDQRYAALLEKMGL
jgi:serine/threonine protein kinase/tetratricopeptide (TPR) repeat protein